MLKNHEDGVTTMKAYMYFGIWRGSLEENSVADHFKGLFVIT